MTTTRSPFDTLDPAAEAMMRSLIGGAIGTQAIYVAASLGIADLLTLEPLDAGELARRSRTHPATLRRVLRYLVVAGVFTEDADGRFALNDAAQLLQTAHPRSLRPTAIRAGEGLWHVAGRLMDAVRTGSTPHADVNGSSYFDHMSHSGKVHAFSSRMGASTDGLGSALAQLDCVRRAGTIVDVGGGFGSVLGSVLREHPHLRGVVFDQPSVIEFAREALSASVTPRDGVLERIDFVAGNFFDAVPAGGDVYLLSWILHDWDDQDACRILGACRAAGGLRASLVIAEVLLPAKATRREGVVPGLIADPFTLDLQMLLLTGGRERTAEEYRGLLAAAGYRVRSIDSVPSRRGVSAIEAHPVQKEGQE